MAGFYLNHGPKYIAGISMSMMLIFSMKA